MQKIQEILEYGGASPVLWFVIFIGLIGVIIAQFDKAEMRKRRESENH
tara:strand:- start:149 stop:292 length:144 start_codon:yes stop_codon:yes gene_type:complete